MPASESLLGFLREVMFGVFSQVLFSVYVCAHGLRCFQYLDPLQYVGYCGF